MERVRRIVELGMIPVNITNNKNTYIENKKIVHQIDHGTDDQGRTPVIEAPRNRNAVNRRNENAALR